MAQVLAEAATTGRRATVTAVERRLGLPHATFYRDFADPSRPLPNGRARGGQRTMPDAPHDLSAFDGLLDLGDVILRYEMRRRRHAITAQGPREQAEQLGLADTAEVVVLAPGGYAELPAHVWPHALLPLAGTRGIGEQVARLTALATGRTTIADLTGAQPVAAAPQVTLAAASGNEHTVSIRGGLVHLEIHMGGPDKPTPSAGAGGADPRFRSCVAGGSWVSRRPPPRRPRD